MEMAREYSYSFITGPTMGAAAAGRAGRNNCRARPLKTKLLAFILP
jgi:hypothetical protein